MRTLPLLALALSLPALAGPSWSQVRAAGGWEDHSTRDHDDAGEVRVYRTTIGGVACFKGTATTEVDAETLLQVAADVPGTVRWSTAGVTQAEMLSQGGGHYEYFQFLDVPGWTLSADRFWFLESDVTREGGTVTFAWDRLEGGGDHAVRYQALRAEHPDAIEPPVNVGGWVFTPTGDRTRIDYYICTDTGGSIPRSVQNAATTRTLPDTVGDLVREGRRRSR